MIFCAPRLVTLRMAPSQKLKTINRINTISIAQFSMTKWIQNFLWKNKSIYLIKECIYLNPTSTTLLCRSTADWFSLLICLLVCSLLMALWMLLACFYSQFSSLSKDEFISLVSHTKLYTMPKIHATEIYIPWFAVDFQYYKFYDAIKDHSFWI